MERRSPIGEGPLRPFSFGSGTYVIQQVLSKVVISRDLDESGRQAAQARLTYRGAWRCIGLHQSTVNHGHRHAQRKVMIELSKFLCTHRLISTDAEAFDTVKCCTTIDAVHRNLRLSNDLRLDGVWTQLSGKPGGKPSLV